MRLLPVFLSILFFSTSVFADYGWMAPYKGGFFRGGFQYFSTSENFADDGVRTDTMVNGQPTSLSEFKFWLEPEYTFAQDWAARLRLEMVNGSVDPAQGATGQSLLTRSGLGDITLGVKRSLFKKKPSLAGEFTIKVPTYSNLLNNLTTLLPGDGNVDVGLIAHLGHHYRNVFFALSPGLLFRFGGYSSALTIKSAVGARFKPFYFYVFTESIFSFSDNLLFDSSPTNHNAVGTGGSYARLSGAPTGTDLGLKAGIQAIPHWFFEVNIQNSLFGKRYPNAFQGGLSVVYSFNLFEPDPRVRIKEVPFDSNQTEFPQDVEEDNNTQQDPDAEVRDQKSK